MEVKQEQGRRRGIEGAQTRRDDNDNRGNGSRRTGVEEMN